MCGRYEFCTDFEELRQIAQDALRRSSNPKGDLPRSAEILPGCLAPVMIARGDKVIGDLQTFGLLNPHKNALIINARAETVTQKPMFARNIAAQRCVVPTAGFYEWDGEKHKYHFTLPGEDAVYLAGIYDIAEDGSHFVILTTAPNASMQPIHDRMPLILRHDQVRPWLTDPVFALQMLATVPPLLHRIPCDGQLSLFD